LGYLLLKGKIMVTLADWKGRKVNLVNAMKSAKTQQFRRELQLAVRLCQKHISQIECKVLIG